jgi:glucose/arabinose dehydrogenase
LVVVFGMLPFVSASAGAAPAQQLPDGFVEDAPITGFNRPIAFAWLPDGRMLVGEKGGSIRLVKDQILLQSPVIEIAVTQSYDAGLLGIAVDPQFETQSYLYVYYTVSPRSLNYTGALHNRVSRFRMMGDQASLRSEEVLIDDISLDTTTNHNGGDLRFGPDGMLYISVGDSGASERAQDLDTLNGKILRVDPNTGLGAPDNPFSGIWSSPERNRVWAYGLRNPFRFVFEPGTTTIYAGDVGFQTYEELNRITPGLNYGWPLQEGPNAPGAQGVENPLFAYARTENRNPDFDGCSTIIGGDFVGGGNFPSTFAGAYFFADYTCQRIWYFLPGSDPLLFAREAGNPVHLAFGPDGLLYYTDILANALRRIRHTTGNRPPTASADATPRTGAIPMEVQFDSAGSFDPDGDALRYRWDFGDGTTSTEAAPRHVYVAAEPVTVTLAVADTQGATSNAVPLTLWPGNTLPTATIQAPLDGARVRAGTTIILRGEGRDAEDGVLNGEALSWEAILHHGTSHTHLWNTATGEEARFTMPAPEDLATAGISFLEVTLTARDQQGATSQHKIRLLPDTVELTFQTEPPGLMVKLDGQLYRTPVTLPSAKGWAFGVRNHFQTTSDCRGFVVGQWSNGKPPDHRLVTPNTDATITATMQEMPIFCYRVPVVMR